MKRVVAIDGPAGSGKSTVALKLAKRLDFIHLNSGALFRSLGIHAERQGISLEDEDELTDLAKKLSFVFSRAEGGETVLSVNGEDLTSQIDSREAGERASRLAVHPKVRDVFVSVQRQVAKDCPVVVEGRDAGTVVFPEADFKFYLDAAVGERAKRRLEQLSSGDSNARFEDILQELRTRDERDTNRDVAPQVKADDATLIDTTSMTVEEVIDFLVQHIRRNNQDAG